MKITLFCILLFILSVKLQSLLSQNAGFEIIIPTEKSSSFTDAKEDHLGNVIMTGLQRTPGSLISNAVVVKCNAQGDTTIRYFNLEGDSSCSLHQIIILPDSNYLAFGAMGKLENINLAKYHNRIWLIKLNQNLGVLWEKHFKLPGSYWNPGYRVIMHNNEVIYGAGNCHWWEGNTYKNHFFMVKFNLAGDTLKTSFPFMDDPFGVPLGGLSGNVMERHHNEAGMMAIGAGFVLPIQKVMVDIDSCLNYTIHNFTYPSNYSFNEIHVKRYNETQYLFSSGIHITYQGNMDMHLAIFNEYHVMQDNIIYGRTDTADLIAHRKSIDFVDYNRIFQSSRENILSYANMNSKSSVALIDSSLNLLGWKFFGGDMNYSPSILTATKDGGCMINGSVRDWQNSPPEVTYFWIKKIFEVDLITNAEETACGSDSDVKVYPNPGNNRINIATIRKNLSISLYSSDGKLLMKQDINDFPIQSINASHLKKGQYPYLIMDKLQKQAIDKGLWIKN
jgi:hypothetical protein